MKAKILILGLAVFLATSGATCINDQILVPLDVDFTTDYTVNPGSSYNDFSVEYLDSLVSEDFRSDVENGRIYDIIVYVTGNYSGNVTGTSRITFEGTTSTVFTYNGPWSAFQAGQSLLGKSPYITPQSAGITTLVRFFMAGYPGAYAMFSATGTLSPASTTQLGIHIRFLGQADAVVKSGDGDGGIAP